MFLTMIVNKLVYNGKTKFINATKIKLLHKTNL